MELHPIMERNIYPNSGLWYVLSAMGDWPTVRVGLTCTHIPGSDGTNGKVYVIGGANPSETFGDVYVLDLDTFSWEVIDADGFRPRYEHAAFVPEKYPNKIFVFGGADQEGNFNDITVLDIVTNTWERLHPRGTAPSARTFHTSACVGDKFIVYSGGHCGSDPVGDRSVHCYDAAANEWTVLDVKGDPPKRRHGHIMVGIGNKVYLHGGMAGTTFFDDLHVLDLQKKSWSLIKKKKVFPYARAGHGAVVIGTDIYVFGGMNQEGALCDMYKFDTVSNRWSLVEVTGPTPTNRLDYGICAISLKVPSKTTMTTDELIASQSRVQTVLDSQRGGSGGSVRSASSAGSQRSISSAGSAPAAINTVNLGALDDLSPPLDTAVSTPDTEEGSGDAATASASGDESANDQAAAAAEVTHKTVQMVLVLCGMDTEGQIFQDCLVYNASDSSAL